MKTWWIPAFVMGGGLLGLLAAAIIDGQTELSSSGNQYLGGGATLGGSMLGGVLALVVAWQVENARDRRAGLRR